MWLLNSGVGFCVAISSLDEVSTLGAGTVMVVSSTIGVGAAVVVLSTFEFGTVVGLFYPPLALVYWRLLVSFGLGVHPISVMLPFL